MLSMSSPFSNVLAILTGKTVVLNLVQEFIEIEAWLLLTLFICLHNQLISVVFSMVFGLTQEKAFS